MTSPQRVCFGIPSVFSFASKTCSTCQDFGHCRRLAHDKLKAASETPAIRAALVMHERHLFAELTPNKPEPQTAPAASGKTRPSRAKHKSYELTDLQKATVAALPVKAGKLVEKVFRRGQDALIRMALRDGRLDDLEVGRSLKTALCLLKKGFDRQTLRTCFMEEMGWSSTSAWNEVSLLWAALPAMGVAHEKHGRLVVAPSVKSKNGE